MSSRWPVVDSETLLTPSTNEAVHLKMNAAVMNMAFMFGAMQVAKRIPFDDHPEYVRYAQLGYATAQLLCLAVYYFCSVQVRGRI